MAIPQKFFKRTESVTTATNPQLLCLVSTMVLRVDTSTLFTARMGKKRCCYEGRFSKPGCRPLNIAQTLPEGSGNFKLNLIEKKDQSVPWWMNS